MDTNDIPRIRKGAKAHAYIKEWMDHLGVSDETMAGRIGVASRTTVWKRYTEQHRLDMGKIQEFADALGISRSQLNYPPGVQSLDALVENATPEQRKIAAELILTVLRQAG
jgi:hypothetical protein